MAQTFKRIDLGGEGREWGLLYSISKLKDDEDKKYPLLRVIIFRVQTIEEAKATVLNLLKRAYRGVRNTRNKILTAQAMPYGIENGQRVGYGDEMLRPKFKYSNKRILRIKNPNMVLVQGYGAETDDKIYEINRP